MIIADFIAEFLAEKGITDVFGIPGGVILELLYAFKRAEGIIPHLSYHEQCAAFEASGYAQSGNIPGVAFATRGPGIMNTVTSVADAYCDSTAMIVFTAHSNECNKSRIRVVDNQEFDLQPLFCRISKAFIRIDDLDMVEQEIYRAFYTANSGRKGPVVVDINASLFTQNIELKKNIESYCIENTEDVDEKIVAEDICKAISDSTRPIILIGDGIKQAGMADYIRHFAEINSIPILSSRYSEDVVSQSTMYFGYIGTHAVRFANFILSKADLIVGVGNRMAFPIHSASYRPLVERTKIIRVDVDKNEFDRKIPGSKNYCVDLKNLMPNLRNKKVVYSNSAQWVSVCNKLKEALTECDVTEPVRLLTDILMRVDDKYTITSDVGNNEMWLSRAYIKASCTCSILYSKSFGALGCSLAKAIGAYYATKRPVVCITGDQGLQLNIQELQLISHANLPIIIILLNNYSSGMIREHEEIAHGKDYLLVTEDSGYSPVNAEGIAKTYGLKYYVYSNMLETDKNYIFKRKPESPMLIELRCGMENNVTPILKRGDPCQKLYPYIEEKLYNKLNNL